jgi:hypothetical protein
MASIFGWLGLFGITFLIYQSLKFCMRKGTVILLVVCLVVSSLITFTVTFVSAQTGHEPSVPEFGVKFIDNSYIQPPRTTIDQYTGKEIILDEGGHLVRQMTTEVTIKNQPFTPYTNADGQKCELYYSIWAKGHFGEGWILLGVGYTFSHYQSDSGYTIVPLTTEYYDAGSQLDFRVRAAVSNSNAQSDWSIQTVTVPTLSPSQTATFPPVTSEGNGQPQYPHQTQPPKSGSISTNPFFLFGAGALFACVVIAVVLVVLSTTTNMW